MVGIPIIGCQHLSRLIVNADSFDAGKDRAHGFFISVRTGHKMKFKRMVSDQNTMNVYQGALPII